MKKIVILTAILFTTLLSAQAQNIDDPGGDVDVPVDGGLSLLIAAGAAYGARRMKNCDAKPKK